jgi:hypothetical protein
MSAKVSSLTHRSDDVRCCRTRRADLFFQIRLSLPGDWIDRERSMHVEDFPLTIGLVVAIGHTESGFLLDSGIIRLGEVLKAVGHGHRAVGFDLQIDEITF